MGRVVNVLVVLAIAAVCGRCALGLPPTKLSDYRLGEALLLGGLGGAPVIFAVLASLAMAPNGESVRASRLRRAAPTVFFVFAVLGIVTCGGMAPTREGLEPAIVERIRSCPMAREALGDGIRRKMVGWQSATVVKKPAPRWTRFDVLAEGERAEGRVRVIGSGVIDANGEHHSQPLVLLRADLHTSTQAIDLLRCGEAAAGPVPERKFEGRVREAEGAAVSVGTSCTIEAGPGSNSHNCRFVITCGDATLYGRTEDLGFAVCGLVKTEAGPRLAARNERTSAAAEIPLRDDEPQLTFDEREGRATLQSADGTERVVIAF